MAADKKSLLRDALKLVQAGKTDKAVETYRAAAKLDPRDAAIRNLLGDLYVKQGKKKEAVAEYLEASDLFERDGFGLRSIALCQKVINLDPAQAAVRLRLADLYAGQKLLAEARGQYLLVADQYDRKGEVAAALEVFRKIADLEPDNLQVRAKLAGMFEKQKFPQRAAEEYVRAAKGHAAAKEMDAAAELFARAFELHPDNAEARLWLADHHARRQDWPAVVSLLEAPVAKGLGDTRLLLLYAEANLRVNRPRDAVSTLEALRGREPNSAPVNLALGRACHRAGDVEKGNLALGRCVSAHLAENRPDAALALLREMSEAAPDDEAVLRRILEVDPKDEMAAERLRRLVAPAASAAPSPEEPFSSPSPPAGGVAEIDLEGDESPATVGVEEDEELTFEFEEEEEPLLEPVVVAEAPEAVAAAAEAVAAPAEAVAELEEAVAPEAVAEPVQEPERPASGPALAAEPDLAGEAQTAAEAAEEPETEVPPELEAETTPATALETAPLPAPQAVRDPAEAVEQVVAAEPATAVDQEPELEPVVEATPGPEFEIPISPELAVPPEPEPVAVLAPESEPEPANEPASKREEEPEPVEPQPPPALEEFNLDDFGVATEERRYEEQPSAAQSTGAGGEALPDFFGELRGEFDSQTDFLPTSPPPQQLEEGLAEVFQQFQRSVREQLGDEDFDTHYNLGIAYKEMGLVDEALAEFAHAEKSSGRRLEALSMAALCLREQGRLDEAGLKLRTAVSLAPDGSDQQKGFLYDLAALEEQAGRTAEAAETLARLHAIDPAYRDVAARAVPAQPPPGSPRRKRPKVSYL